MPRKKKEAKSARVDVLTALTEEIEKLASMCPDRDAFMAGMDRVLSLKGQADVEPMRFCVPESSVIREYRGDTFTVSVTSDGAMYHSYGGYTVFADLRDRSLMDTLVMMCDFLSGTNTDGLTDEERRMLAGDTEAKSYVITAPMWCFGDIEATYGIATSVVHEMSDMSERLMSEPLRPEDAEANDEFRDAVMSVEDLRREDAAIVSGA